jgi:hypothetical protein
MCVNTAATTSAIARMASTRCGRGAGGAGTTPLTAHDPRPGPAPPARPWTGDPNWARRWRGRPTRHACRRPSRGPARRLPVWASEARGAGLCDIEMSAARCTSRIPPWTSHVPGGRSRRHTSGPRADPICSADATPQSEPSCLRTTPARDAADLISLAIQTVGHRSLAVGRHGLQPL